MVSFRFKLTKFSLEPHYKFPIKLGMLASVNVDFWHCRRRRFKTIKTTAEGCGYLEKLDDL